MILGTPSMLLETPSMLCIRYYCKKNFMTFYLTLQEDSLTNISSQQATLFAPSKKNSLVSFGKET